MKVIYKFTYRNKGESLAGVQYYDPGHQNWVPLQERGKCSFQN